MATSKSSIVRFSWWDIHLATKHADYRTTISSAANLTHQHFANDYKTKTENELIGVLGEMAVDRFLGGSGTVAHNSFKAIADCGHNIDVRTTQRPDGRLIIRPTDPDDRINVLVVIDQLSARLVGWLKGSEAKQAQFFWAANGKTPAYFVRQEKLHPMEKLQRQLLTSYDDYATNF